MAVENSGRWYLGCVVALLLGACTPEVGPPVLTDKEAWDSETHAAATDAVPSTLPQGVMYAAANHGISRSVDGGQTWERARWDDVIHNAPRCQFVYSGEIVPLGGDPDIKVQRGFVSAEQTAPIPVSSELGSYPAYVSFLFKAAIIAPDQIVLYHTGYEGALIDDKVQCHVIDVGEELGKGFWADKTAIALVPRTPYQPAALWVSWQWHYFSTDSFSQFYTVVPLEDSSGDFLAHEPIKRLNNPGEDDPSQPTIDWGPCTPPPGGMDDAGRGNMFADVDGNVYLAYSNNGEYSDPDGSLGCPPNETRRIYVRRLTGEANKDPFHACIDQIDEVNDCATGAPIIEEDDPSIVVDPRTGGIVVAYLSQPDDAQGRRRVTLAWSADGKSWGRQVVGQTDVDQDQSQVALATTTSFDPLDRVVQGTYFLTWYEPISSIVPMVERRAQKFNSSLQAITPTFALSPWFFPRDYNTPLCNDCNRGVWEYQGAAHAPGADRWLAAWTAPRDPLNPDLADDNFGIWTNTVP